MKTTPQALVNLCEQLPSYGKLIVSSSSITWVRSWKIDASQLVGVLGLRTEDEVLEVERFPDGFRVTMRRTVEITAM